ncbi:Calx-beta domain-containing protein [Tautonia rosea]|uniref:Calx-beta domain-containing protein n=1 Tax=Tautonia rosea TaxID=2728037 RepID=UPI00147559EB|nr:LamG-like jellyroll fold domain-containing protein [Tautonia rosea]
MDPQKFPSRKWTGKAIGSGRRAARRASRPRLENLERRDQPAILTIVGGLSELARMNNAFQTPGRLTDLSGTAQEVFERTVGGALSKVALGSTPLTDGDGGVELSLWTNVNLHQPGVASVSQQIGLADPAGNLGVPVEIKIEKSEPDEQDGDPVTLRLTLDMAIPTYASKDAVTRFDYQMLVGNGHHPTWTAEDRVDLGGQGIWSVGPRPGLSKTMEIPTRIGETLNFRFLSTMVTNTLGVVSPGPPNNAGWIVDTTVEMRIEKKTSIELTELTWSGKKEGGVKFEYQVNGPDPILKAPPVGPVPNAEVPVEFFWAKGPNYPADVLGNSPIHTTTIPYDRLNAGAGKPIVVPGKKLQGVPEGAFYLIAVADRQNSLGVFDPQNTVRSMPLKMDVISSKQGNPLWKTQQLLLHPTDTIGGFGCALTSLFMSLHAAGINTITLDGSPQPLNPSTLNTLLVRESAGSVPLNARIDFGIAARMVINHVGASNYRWVPFTTSNPQKLRDRLLETGMPIISWVPSLTRPGNSHFVLITGIAGDTFFINDPGFDHVLLSDYAQFPYPNFETRGYVVDPPDVSGLYVTASSDDHDLELSLIDPHGRVSSVTVGGQIVRNQIPDAVPFADLPIADLDGTSSLATTATASVYLPLPPGGNFTIRVSGSSHPSSVTIASALPDSPFEQWQALDLPPNPGTPSEFSIFLDPNIYGVPHVTIAGAEAIEGDIGTTEFVFPVTLSRAPTGPLTIAYATADGSATVADGDYIPVSGTLTFVPGGPLTQHVKVLVRGDTRSEPDESFAVVISSEDLVRFDETRAAGVIVDDDAAISIRDASREEGNGGPSPMTFIVSLSRRKSVPVSVDFTTADGTATSGGNDYRPIAGTITFQPGETLQRISVDVLGDLTSEGDETFFVRLANPVNASIADGGDRATGTIRDDDAPGAVYYVNDASTLGDVFTIAPGDNANDGRSPATPMASLTGLLLRYSFQPGDTIYVDAGAYTLARNVSLGPAHSGVRIIGAGQVAVMPLIDPAAILAENPVAYWRLGEAGVSDTAFDAAGRGLHGRYVGGIRRVEAAPSTDGAAEFDGKTGSVVIPDSPLLNPQQFTFAAWIDDRGNQDDAMPIASKVDATYGYYGHGWRLEYRHDTMWFQVFNSFSQWLLSVPRPAAGWTHVAVTHDGSTASLYVNGQLAGTAAMWSPSPSSAPLEIGGGVPSYSQPDVQQYWKGSIDEVVLFDRVLSAEAIASQYRLARWTGTSLDRNNQSEGAVGIEVTDATSVVIADLSIVRADVGIRAAGSGSTDLAVRGVELGDVRIGVEISSASHRPAIVASTFRSNSQHALWSQSNGARLVDSTIVSSASYGSNVLLIQGSDAIIENNDLLRNSGGLALITDRAGLIRGNRIRDTSWNTAAIWVLTSESARVWIEGNEVIGSHGTGIDAAGPGISVRGNTVSGGLEAGLVLRAGTQAIGNTVSGNRDGIVHAPFRRAFGWLTNGPALIQDNIVFGNSNIGISVHDTGEVVGNRVYGNGIGVVGQHYDEITTHLFSQFRPIPFRGTIRNNLIYGNREAGIQIQGAAGPKIFNNTIVQPGGQGFEVSPPTGWTARDVRFTSNIVQVGSGHAIHLANNGQTNFTSDFNLFKLTGSGKIGWSGGEFTSIFDWRAEVGVDFNSLVADPQFMDPAGPDGILGFDPVTGIDGGRDDNFRLRSGSPGIAAGDPSADASRQPQPSGARINVGADGGTPEATPTGPVGVLILESGGATAVVAGGPADSYSIVLTAPPTSDVVISLSTDRPLNLSTHQLVFTPANWRVPRAVNVRRVAPEGTTGDDVVTIRHTIASADTRFDGIAVRNVSVDVVERQPSPIRAANARAIPGDYDGDGITDLAIYTYAPQYGQGRFDIRPSSHLFGETYSVFLGFAGGIPVSGDFDGDGITDIAVVQPETDINGDLIPDLARWLYIPSSKPPGSEPVIIDFGAPGIMDRPAPADYDGDGITDIATFRANSDLTPGAAEWFILGSSAGAFRVAFGAASGVDLPAPGDYDGDGRDDIVTFRPVPHRFDEARGIFGVAQWFVLPSRVNDLQYSQRAGAFPVVFGAAGNADQPAPADFDGDGRTDIMAFRSITDLPDAAGRSDWFLLQSAPNDTFYTSTPPPGGRRVTFGNAGDIAAVGDYDGDGRPDAVVFRPEDGNWIVRSGLDGTQTQQAFGTPGANAVPVLAPLYFRLRATGNLPSQARSAGLLAGGRGAGGLVETRTTPIDSGTNSSNRQIARDFGHTRETIRQVLNHAEPPVPPTRFRKAPLLNSFESIIDWILNHDEISPSTRRKP